MKFYENRLNNNLDAAGEIEYSRNPGVKFLETK